MNKKFDFSEIDGALPTAEKMQEQDRIIDALKNNYEAVRILSANVEKLENRLSEALPKMDGAVSSLRGASTVTLGEEARKTLEQEGEKICRKMANHWMNLPRRSSLVTMTKAITTVTKVTMQ